MRGAGSTRAVQAALREDFESQLVDSTLARPSQYVMQEEAEVAATGAHALLQCRVMPPMQLLQCRVMATQLGAAYFAP